MDRSRSSSLDCRCYSLCFGRVENSTDIRPEPIMLLEYAFEHNSQKSLLCLKLCSGILSDNVKFNRLN